MMNISNHPLKNNCSLAIKRALIILPIMVIAAPSYAESFTAKRAGQGFTGITQDFTSSLSNPALLTKYDDDDDVFLSLNLGAMASDEYEVREIIEDISDDLDVLIDDINNIPYQNFTSVEQVNDYNDDLYEQADAIINDFGTIDEKVVKIRNGINFQVIIPNQYFSFGLFSNQYGRIGGLVDYVPTDEDVLYDSIDAGNLELSDLDSSIYGIGYSIAEIGVMGAYPLVNHANYDVNIGAKIKYQRIDLYYNNISMSNLDDDDYDAGDDQYITDENGSNIDLGFYSSFGENRQWHAALVVNNLMKQSVTHTNQAITFDLKTSAILGLSYQMDWLSISTEIDLIEREQFETLEASKYAGVGAEFRLADHMQFRLGYRTDLNDVDDNIYTVGLGISPWDILAFDIAAFTGDSDTLGAALQVSLKI